MGKEIFTFGDIEIEKKKKKKLTAIRLLLFQRMYIMRK